VSVTENHVDVAARGAGAIIGEHAGNGRIEITPSTIKLGKDATDFVALSSKVDALFALFKKAIHDAATTTGDGGAGFKAAILATLGSGELDSVAATRTKAK
jgi:hypothetical protein